MLPFYSKSGKLQPCKVGRFYGVNNSTAKRWLEAGLPTDRVVDAGVWQRDLKREAWNRRGQTKRARSSEYQRKEEILALFRSDKLGHKAIAKRLSISPGITRTILIESGEYTPGQLFGGEEHRRQCREAARHRASRDRKPLDPIVLMADAFAREQKAKWPDWSCHPEFEKWRALRYYYANHEAGKARSRIAAKKQWDKIKADDKLRGAKLARAREWQRRNTEYRRVWNRQYLAANPGKKREYRRKRNAKPCVKVVNNLRRRLRRFLIKGERHQSSTALIGCSLKELRAHIERQFMAGMHWNNYGTRWVVDHKVPCAVFDLNDPIEQRRCFHWTNLRPLWSEANQDKSDTVLFTEQMIELYG